MVLPLATRWVCLDAIFVAGYVHAINDGYLNLWFVGIIQHVFIGPTDLTAAWSGGSSQLDYTSVCIHECYASPIAQGVGSAHS